MWLEDEKEQAVGKVPGKNIPGRWKHICKDPEVKAIVGSLWNRRMPSVAGENERKVPDGDQRGGQGLDHAFMSLCRRVALSRKTQKVLQL